MAVGGRLCDSARVRRDTIQTTTADGLTLRMRRVRPTGAVGKARATAILMHGLSANGVVFDAPERSLAAFLAQAGIESYIPDLRGAGLSDRPAGQWGVDDYVSLDLPALLAAVQADSGAQTLQWVGHSMGGILLFFHMMEHPDAPIGRAVTLGSAFDYGTGGSVYGQLHRLLPLVRWMGFLPFGQLCRANAEVAGVGPALPPEALNFHRSNIDIGMMRHILLHGFHRIPMRLFGDLATTFSAQGFSRDGGRIIYRSLLERYRLPTLFIGGSDDGQAPLGAVEETARLLSKHPDSRLVVLGRGRGQRDDYGHFDLLVGERAPDEVWSLIREHLVGQG